jgi:hypothetical protein
VCEKRQALFTLIFLFFPVIVVVVFVTGTLFWLCFHRFQYQRVFDTVRCASLAVESSIPLASTPTTDGPRLKTPRLVVNTCTPIAEISPSFQKAESVLKKLTASSETDYP